MRWMWVDRFTEFESKKSAKSIKNLSLAEDHFAQHFPGYPVMPVSLMLEDLPRQAVFLSAKRITSRRRSSSPRSETPGSLVKRWQARRWIYSTSIIDLRSEGATIEGHGAH